MTYSTNHPIQPLTRGCGKRKAGGIYWETGLSPEGAPLEDFLFCPPVPIPDGLKVNPRGVTPIEQDGVVHLIDWVGESHYPNLADFIEEVRRYGLSRRIPSTAPFAQLTAKSRLLLVHPRALITNWMDYTHDDPEAHHCPKNRPAHTEPDDLTEMCSGFWWQDVEGGETGSTTEPRMTRRSMPSFHYYAWTRPPGVNPAYQPAFFASFPRTGQERVSKATTTSRPLPSCAQPSATACPWRSSMPENELPPVPKTMKAITVHQPWASCLIHRYKRFETRSWPVRFSDWVAIHAGKKDPGELYNLALQLPHVHPLHQPDLPRGAVLGWGYLSTCHSTHSSALIHRLNPTERALGNYMPNRYAWEFTHLFLLHTPIPARGMQGIWSWTRPDEPNGVWLPVEDSYV